MSLGHIKGTGFLAGTRLACRLPGLWWICALVAASGLILFSPIALATSAEAYINLLEADVKRSRGVERVVAHGRLAMALDANGRVGEALKEYRRLSRQRGDDQWRYLLGVTLVQSGQYAEAVRVLRRVVDRLPEARPAQFWLAVAQQGHQGDASWDSIAAQTVSEMAAISWSELNHAQRLTIHWTLVGYPDDPILDQRIEYIRDPGIVRDYVDEAGNARPLSALRVLWSLPGDRTFYELGMMARLGVALGQEASAASRARAS